MVSSDKREMEHNFKEYGGSSWTVEEEEMRVTDRQKTQGMVELAAEYFPDTGRIFAKFSAKKGSRELVELLKTLRSESTTTPRGSCR